MIANPVLLQKKYARLVELFAKSAGISFEAALDFFYLSKTYLFIKDGVSDMHCMSDDYLVEDLMREYQIER